MLGFDLDMNRPRFLMVGARKKLKLILMVSWKIFMGSHFPGFIRMYFIVIERASVLISLAYPLEKYRLSHPFGNIAKPHNDGNIATTGVFLSQCILVILDFEIVLKPMVY